MYDVIIAGGGPAGLTAAIYLAAARFKCLVLEKSFYGGQIALTEKVKNYPGISSISGMELADNMRSQAEEFGAEFAIEEIKEIKIKEETKIVETAKRSIETKTVIIATGAAPRKVGFTGEEEFIGKGVSYCATCDGRLFTGKEVFVVGAGLSACQESLHLVKHASKVRMIIRKDRFQTENNLTQEIEKNPNIEVYFNTEIEEVNGDGMIEEVTLVNNKTKKREKFSTNGSNYGVFVFVGYAPEAELCRGLVERDDNEYIITDDGKNTNIPGICAAGDVCVKKLRQVITAASDGAIAAKTIEKILRDLK